MKHYCGSWLLLNNIKVVIREAKKGQSDHQKQNAWQATVCFFTRADVFVIWRHNHSQYLSTRVNF